MNIQTKIVPFKFNNMQLLFNICYEIKKLLFVLLVFWNALDGVPDCVLECTGLYSGMHWIVFWNALDCVLECTGLCSGMF